MWRQDLSRAAEPRAKLTRRSLRWALEALVIGHLTIARVAEALAVSWNPANSAVLAEGRRLLIDDPARFAGVRVIGVHEFSWATADSERRPATYRALCVRQRRARPTHRHR